MTRFIPLYEAIATAVDAYMRSASDTANEAQQAWTPRWESYLYQCTNLLPSGSGFDSRPEINADDSTAEVLKISGSFHRMNDVGMYDGWQDFRISIRPSLIHKLRVTVTSARGDLAGYIADTYADALRALVNPARIHAMAGNVVETPDLGPLYPDSGPVADLADVPDLDSMNLDSLPDAATVRATGAALQTLAYYAANKASAMTSRATGHDTYAREMESACQRLYGRLPPSWRW